MRGVILPAQSLLIDIRSLPQPPQNVEVDTNHDSSEANADSGAANLFWNSSKSEDENQSEVMHDAQDRGSETCRCHGRASICTYVSIALGNVTGEEFSHSIACAYKEIVTWKRNIFRVPSGAEVCLRTFMLISCLC